MLTAAEPDTIAYLRSPQAIRERCSRLFELACADRLRYFRCDLSQLDAVAEFVLAEMRVNYPDFNIPFHSRWRHFEVGSSPRLQQLDQAIAGMTPLERTRTRLDLAIVSVLLDAGAGAEWHYQEPDGQIFGRSEGLAVASFHLFCQGMFSSNPANPYQVDAVALEQLTEFSLGEGFQVSPENPLVGLTGRLQLLQKLGSVLRSLPSSGAPSRPGDLLWQILRQVQVGAVEASWVLTVVLEQLSEIWAGRLRLHDRNLGDVWHHSALAQQSDSGESLVPFHKLSQWLTYSLLEPLQGLGLAIGGLDELTGLPEYRNGGLCLDLGLLQIKELSILQEPLFVDSEAIVEWRALTVILLDLIADTLRQKLQMTAAELPLVKVLQGGTWSAGRKIAAERRPGGVPPLSIVSDGTVF